MEEGDGPMIKKLQYLNHKRDPFLVLPNRTDLKLSVSYLISMKCTNTVCRNAQSSVCTWVFQHVWAAVCLTCRRQSGFIWTEPRGQYRCWFEVLEEDKDGKVWTPQRNRDRCLPSAPKGKKVKPASVDKNWPDSAAPSGPITLSGGTLPSVPENRTSLRRQEQRAGLRLVHLSRSPESSRLVTRARTQFVLFYRRTSSSSGSSFHVSCSL